MDYTGIVYRLWGESGIFALLGIVCIFIGFVGRHKAEKQCCLAGVLLLLWAAFSAIDYASALHSPEIVSFCGTFDRSYRNSRVAPPLPLTMEYNFYDEEGACRCLYLDILSEKNIVPQGFTQEENYIIYYEADTNIIIMVEEPVS